jgi:hypothetical protein
VRDAKGRCNLPAMVCLIADLVCYHAACAWLTLDT